MSASLGCFEIRRQSPGEAPGIAVDAGIWLSEQALYCLGVLVCTHT